MKITFTAHGFSSDKTIAENESYAKSLGFPKIGLAEGPLAVVGGGPSIVGRLGELRAFDGEVWAINGAWKWLRGQGVDAVFFSVDQNPVVADMARGARKAVLAMCCAPDVFDTIPNIEAALIGGLNGTPTGPTTATAAAFLAITKGHTQITYYGCESSYLNGKHHAYNDVNPGELIKVVCGGEEFLTKPGMMMQAEHLGAQIRAAGGVLKERSGGLLAAYIRDPNIDVIAGSRSLWDRVK